MILSRTNILSIDVTACPLKWLKIVNLDISILKTGLLKWSFAYSIADSESRNQPIQSYDTVSESWE